MRRLLSSKPNTYTETAGVNAAGISVKVTRITLGGLLLCHWLTALRGVGMQQQKSADAIVGLSPQTEGLNKRYGVRTELSMMVELQKIGMRNQRPKPTITNRIGNDTF